MPSYSPAATTSAQTRVFNTWVMISDQRTTRVAYSIIIKTGATLAAGNIGRIILDIADDALGTNMTALDSADSGQDAGLLIPGSTGSIKITGVVPVAKYMRLRSVNVLGTGATYSSYNPNTGTTTANSGFGTETLYD